MALISTCLFLRGKPTDRHGQSIVWKMLGIQSVHSLASKEALTSTLLACLLVYLFVCLYCLDSRDTYDVRRLPEYTCDAKSSETV